MSHTIKMGMLLKLIFSVCEPHLFLKWLLNEWLRTYPFASCNYKNYYLHCVINMSLYLHLFTSFYIDIIRCQQEQY
jgi:hypothetical protein